LPAAAILRSDLCPLLLQSADLGWGLVHTPGLLHGHRRPPRPAPRAPRSWRGPALGVGPAAAPPPPLSFPLRIPYRTNECAAASCFTRPPRARGPSARPVRRRRPAGLSAPPARHGRMLPLLEALEEAGPLPRDGVGPPRNCGGPHPQGQPLASLVPLSAVSGLGAAGESYAVRWSTGEARAPPARAPASRGGKMCLLRRPRSAVRDTSVGHLLQAGGACGASPREQRHPARPQSFERSRLCAGAQAVRALRAERGHAGRSPRLARPLTQLRCEGRRGWGREQGRCRA
jgi:hypothetical protein